MLDALGTPVDKAGEHTAAGLLDLAMLRLQRPTFDWLLISDNVSETGLAQAWPSLPPTTTSSCVCVSLSLSL